MANNLQPSFGDYQGTGSNVWIGPTFVSYTKSWSLEASIPPLEFSSEALVGVTGSFELTLDPLTFLGQTNLTAELVLSFGSWLTSFEAGQGFSVEAEAFSAELTALVGSMGSFGIEVPPLSFASLAGAQSAGLQLSPAFEASATVEQLASLGVALSPLILSLTGETTPVGVFALTLPQPQFTAGAGVGQTASLDAGFAFLSGAFTGTPGLAAQMSVTFEELELLLSATHNVIGQLVIVFPTLNWTLTGEERSRFDAYILQWRRPS